MKHVRVVENGLEAKKAIDQFMSEGFTKEEVYLLAHDKDRSEHLSEATDIQDIGIQEQGVFDSMANVFRSRGDKLRAKMRALNLSDLEAQHLEKELDEGRVVVIATGVA
ncbi:general stress protein [Neobacillus sp. NRS-1170]|uniref:general stress protein n=1 Tax=Neobacillus sp. NRS-1170 TaxID=3233898 RepID=UPI003D2A877A